MEYSEDEGNVDEDGELITDKKLFGLEKDLEPQIKNLTLINIHHRHL